VLQLRGSIHIEHSLARLGAERLWKLLNEGGDSYVHALGALTGEGRATTWVPGALGDLNWRLAAACPLPASAPDVPDCPADGTALRHLCS
jgi:isocitrate lyase